MGAIATGGVRILHDAIVSELRIPPELIDLVAAKEQKELERRERLYRGDRGPLTLRDRIVVVVDDGVATGSTMKAALAALHRQGPAQLIVAVPTAPLETCRELRALANEVVCVLTPQPFYSVGGSYSDFRETTDDEVRNFFQQTL